MSQQAVRRRSRPRLVTVARAAVVGASGAFLLAALLACVLLALSATLSLISPSLVDSAVSLLSGGTPGLVVGAVVLLTSGYMAASSASTDKLLSGALVGGVLLAVCGATATLTPELAGRAAPLLAAGPRWVVLASWVFLVVGPVLGAYAQAAVAREGEPPPAGRIARLLLGYSMLVAGTFVLSTAILALALFPGRLAPAHVSEALPGGYSTGAAAGLALLLGVGVFAGGLYLLVHGRGWEHAILTNWLVYGLGAWILFYVSLFAYRDLVNRPERELFQTVALRTNARNKPQPGVDGTALLMQALDALAEQPRPPGMADVGLWQPADHPLWAQWLEANAEAVSLALEATRGRAVYPPLQIEPERPAWSQENLAPLQKLCRVLTDRARALAGEGHAPEAIAHMDAAFRIGTSLARGPVAHVRAGAMCHAYAAGVMRDMLIERAREEPEAARLLELVQTWDDGQFASLETARHAIGLDVLWVPEQHIAAWRHGDPVSYLQSQFLTRDLLSRAAERAQDRLLEAEGLLELRALTAEGRGSARGDLSQAERLQRPMEMAADALVELPRADFHALVTDILADCSRLRLLTVAAAARLHEARHQAPVRGWFDLVTQPLPEVPSDPFRGEPLELEATDTELTIYSVGPDGDDDGGAGELLRAVQSGDMVLRLIVRATGETAD